MELVTQAASRQYDGQTVACCIKRIKILVAINCSYAIFGKEGPLNKMTGLAALGSAAKRSCHLNACPQNALVKRLRLLSHPNSGLRATLYELVSCLFAENSFKRILYCEQSFHVVAFK